MPVIDVYDCELPDLADLDEPLAIEVREEVTSYGNDGAQLSGYKRLRVWQLSLDFACESYRLSREFPKDELYGLTSQLRRAVNSVGLNIAEGWGRNSCLELARFCDIARGSLSEADAAFELAVRLEYADPSQVQAAQKSADLISSMLLSLAKSARMKANRKPQNK